MPGYPNSTELAVRQIYRFSKKIVVNSHHQRMNFLRRYPWMEDRVVTIYNGYDLDEFSPPADEAGGTELNILVVGGLAKYKNGLCLVRALNILGTEYGLRPQVSWAGRRAASGRRETIWRTLRAKSSIMVLKGNGCGWINGSTSRPFCADTTCSFIHHMVKGCRMSYVKPWPADARSS